MRPIEFHLAVFEGNFRVLCLKTSRILFLILTGSVFLLLGCAPQVTLTEEQRARLGTVAVVSAVHSPLVNLSRMPLGKHGGAGIGAGRGAGDAAMLQCLDAGLFFPLCLIVAVPIGAGIGAVEGAVKAESVDPVRVKNSENEIQNVINDAQKRLAREIVKYARTLQYPPMLLSQVPGPSEVVFKPPPRPDFDQDSSPTEASDKPKKAEMDYAPIAGEGGNTVLEVSILEIKTFPFQKKNLLAFSIVAGVRIVNVQDNTIVYSNKFRSNTNFFRPGDWVLDGGSNVRREFDQVFENLARIVVDTVFLIEGEINASPRYFFASVPAPEIVGPKGDLCFTSPCGLEDQVQVKSLQPTLVWKKFPGELDVKRFAKRFTGIDQLRYDLALFTFPEGEVYRRHGLSETLHMIEDPLIPCKSYYWTVRARFERNAQQRATLWSHWRREGATLNFRTPCPGPQGKERDMTLGIKDGTTKLANMVRIEGGEFAMGLSGVGGFTKKSTPVHIVTLNPFWLDTHEVSQLDFLLVMGFNPSETYMPGGPVENVFWSNAWLYCNRVGKRLPTEAEWEYAARAGTTKRISILDDTKMPNAWELHNMYRRPEEWVHDWYSPYTAESLHNPRGPSTGTERIVRGQSWGEPAFSRDSLNPASRSDRVGFRCAADIR